MKPGAPDRAGDWIVDRNGDHRRVDAECLKLQSPAEAEEGDECAVVLDGGTICEGRLDAVLTGPDCSCHIAPPCSACVEAGLECTNCGFEVAS